MASSWALPLSIVAFAGMTAMVVYADRRWQASRRVSRRLAPQASQPAFRATSVLRSGETASHPIWRWLERPLVAFPAAAAAVRRQLALAGLDGAGSAGRLVLAIVGGGVAAAIIAAAALTANGAGTAFPSGFVLVMLAGGLGASGPLLLLARRRQARREALEQQFPDALDLLVVCMEAGLAMDSAMVRVGEEGAESHPRVAVEFRRVSEEVAAGRDRGEALRALAERSDLDSIRAFVALLVQSQNLGVSIAQSLRVFAADMRTTRYVRAEEKAMRIPVLMTLPLVLCFMPVILVVLLLPAAIDVVRTLLPSLGRG